MLLAYAAEADRCRQQEFHADSFSHAMFWASYHLAAGRPGGPEVYGPGVDKARRTVLTPDDVADRLSRVALPEVTATALRSALTSAVDAAAYWQPPDGDDLLAAADSVRRELRRVAQHIAGSPYAQWWTAPLDPINQWVIRWGGDETGQDRPAADLLSDYRDQTTKEEA